MSVDWRALSRSAKLPVGDDAIDVGFADGRRQRVNVDETRDGSIRLWSVALRPAMARSLVDPYTYAWTRNRVTELVGFRVESTGRIVGETLVPDVGVTAEEWRLYVLAVARAADRFEYLVSGDDVE